MARPVEHPDPSPSGGDRIAKLLARAGIASRREVERMIEDGRVAVNGVLLSTPATVLPSLDGVTVDGHPVAAPAPTRLFLYHKPVGLLVTEHDPRGRPTIYDRLPADLPRVVSVGRLDLATEGLLLLTTDGGFKRQLELPATGVERAYRARAFGNVTQAQLEALIEGVEIDGIRYGSIDANLERRTGANVWVELILTEGKNREVRRVLEVLGLQVSRLIRTRYGPFVLGDLPPGAVGEVRPSDLFEFRRTLKGGAPLEPIAAEPRPGFRQAPSTDRTRRPSRPGEAGQGPKRLGGENSASTIIRAKPHPGEGRGPVASGANGASPPQPRSPQAARQSRPAVERPRENQSRQAPRQPARPSSSQLDPGLRREGVERKVPAAAAAQDTATPRLARPQRKAGWAKPKPKAGPTRPRKPRA